MFDRWQVHQFTAIVFNYWSAFLLGVVFIAFQQPLPGIQIMDKPWFGYAAGLGLLFLIIFSLAGQTTQRLGVGIASVAMKLGLVFPVLCAFFLYQEPVDFIKISGVILAIISVLLTSGILPGSNQGVIKSGWEIIVPVLVFMGSGLCDAVAQFAQKRLLPPDEAKLFASVDFLFAALTGTLIWFVLLFRNQKICWRSMGSGLLLGIPNFLSFYFLLRTLDDLSSWGSAVVFMLINVSVVISGILVGILLFQEKLTRWQWMGLTLALLAIILVGV